MSNSNKSSNGEGVSNTSLLIFKRKNYIILLIGIITLIIGFILLSGVVQMITSIINQF